jgi:hypothetical protein
MISRNDLAISLLVLVAGFIMYLVSPAGPLYVPIVEGDLMSVQAHAISHYLGGAVAIVSGVVAVAVYKKISIVSLGISLSSLVLGAFLAALAPGAPLAEIVQPHGLAMESVGGVGVLIGLIGVVASVALKPRH